MFTDKITLSRRMWVITKLGMIKVIVYEELKGI